jgi:hypothetical protein
MPKLANDRKKVRDNTLLKKYNKENKTVAQISRETGMSEYRVKARLVDMKNYRYQKYKKKKGD